MTGKSKFIIPDRVFGKLSGFPACPAVIDKINKSTQIVMYDVTFFWN